MVLKPEWCMHEQHTERGRCGRGDREGAIHLGIATRFPHQAAAVQVQTGGGVVALPQRRGSARLGEAVQD